MIGLLWALFAVALGCVLLVSFTGLAALRPRWAAASLIFGAGAAGGIGLTSLIYFVSRLVVPGVRWLGMPIELGLMGLAIWNLERKTGRDPVPAEPGRTVPLMPVVAGGLVCVLLLGTAAISASWDNNPSGDWDAWAIWNMRARMLAAPDHLFQRAWSPLLVSSHPEYPLLTSSFVARCWAYAGGATPEVVPMAVAYLFYLALGAIGVGGVAKVRSPALGLLYGLILAGTPLLTHEATMQYADVPLACYFLGAALFAAADEPILAGLFAGFAAWTKDEGLLFAAVFLVAIALFRRRSLPRVVASLALPVAITLLFKLVLAHGTASLPARSLDRLGPRLADPHRYGLALGALAGAFAAMGAGFYHPLYPAVVAAALLRFDRGQRRTALLFALLAGAMLAGYFVIYIISPDALSWLVGSTVDRLVVQVWPLLLLTLFGALRTAESMLPVPELARTVPVSASARKTRRKQR